MALTDDEYAQILADRGLHFGVLCEHNGFINEGAVFIYIGPAESPWVWALIVRGDLNNFYEGQIAKIHCGLRPLDSMPAWPDGWGIAP